MLDRYVSGECTRISPEAPVPVLLEQSTQSVPGGAANVAMNLVSLGCRTTLVAGVGKDAAGRELRRLVRKAGVTAHFAERSDAVTTVKTRFVVGRVVGFLDDHPDCEVDYAPKYLFDGEHGYRHEIHGSEWSDFAAFFAPHVNLSVMFVRRTAFDAVGGFKDVKDDPHAGLEDAYLFLRLAERRAFHFDPMPRSLYRVHQNQLSTTIPSWYNWMTERICASHPEIIERIMQGDMQSHANEPQRLVRRLMGAVAYLNQRKPEVWRPIFETALREIPDDPGISEIYMTMLRSVREYDRLQAYADEALARFADSPDQKCIILNALAASYRDRGLTPPEELEARLRDAYARWTALPPEIAKCFN